MYRARPKPHWLHFLVVFLRLASQLLDLVLVEPLEGNFETVLTNGPLVEFVSLRSNLLLLR